MPLSGKALATAYVIVRADMSQVSGDVEKGTRTAVDKGARSASGKLKDAITQPLREGFAEGVRQADPGGQAVGGRFRQGVAEKLRGISTDTQKAGAEAGAGIDRGISGKMRDVAQTTAKGGKAAGESFTRGAGGRFAKAGADAGEGFSEAATAATDKGARGLVRSVGGAATKMVGAFAAVEIGERSIEFFKGAIEGASDLSEAGNKLQVLFGPAAPAIQTWAAGAATSLGLSKIAAEDAAATFGVFAQSAGLAGTQSAQFSEKMVGLAGDLASFHNTSPEQAIEAIGAALRGESEPIRQYGILLDDATLRQRALKLGIVDTTKNSLTPQQRVLAAQAEILAQTGAAQGDFARTSSGLANQQRILSAQFTNAQAALGEKLLPVMLTGVSLLNSVVIPAFTGLLGAVSHIPGPVVAAGAALVAIGVAARVGKSALDQISETTKIVGQAMQWMGLRTAEAAVAEGAQATAAEGQVAANDAAAASATRLGSAMGLVAKAGVIAGLAAVKAQVDEAGASFFHAKTDSGSLDSALLHLGQTGEFTGSAIAAFKQGWGPFSQDVHNSGEAIARFGDLAKGAIGGANESFTEMIGRQIDGASRMGQLTAITEQYDASLARLTQGGQGAAAKAVFDQLTKAATDQGVSVDEIRKLFPQYAAAVAAASSAAGGAAAAQKTLAAATGQSAGAAKVAAVTLKDMLNQYPKYKDVVLAAVGATSADSAATKTLTSTQVAAADAAVRHARALDALSDALSASNNKVLDLRGADTAYHAALDSTSQAIKENGRTLDVNTEKGRANRGQLDSLSSAGLTYLGVIEKNNGVGPKFRRTLDQQWAKLRDAALRFGATKTEARKYADQIYATPKALATKVTTPGMDVANKKVRDLKANIDKLGNRALKITVNSDGTFTQGTKIGRAAGGPIPGFSPTPTADNVPVDATAGEHMWSVREVQGAGGHAGVERLRSMARSGRLPRAAGGSITITGSAQVPSARTLNAVVDADMLAAYKAASMGGGGGGPMPKGSGVARWALMMGNALTRMGLPRSLLPNELRQIATESGGNPRAVQGNIGDVNNRSGDLAKGLLQIIGATYRAYHVPGTAWDVFDPWSNMLASLNYQKHRYKGRIAQVVGHGHGYAAGTTNAQPGWQWVGENGRELVHFRGGEDVKTATASRAVVNADDGLVRLHPDTVAHLGSVLAAAMTRQPVVLDGRTITGYVDRSLGRASLSMRG